MFLYDVIDQFESNRIAYALVGGYALAFHGAIRATVDVDIVLNIKLEDYEKAELVLKHIGLLSRIPVRASDIIKMRKEFIETRNLIAWSFVDYKNPSKQLDILITKDLKKMKTVKISVGGRKIVVAALSELLKMKKEAGRPQDLVDVQTILELMNEKNRMSPEEAVQFLEDFRILNQDKDESTQAISIRIPANLLRLVKLKSKAENKKYQSVLIEYIRKGLKQDL